jgi:PKD repeat protein
MKYLKMLGFLFLTLTIVNCSKDDDTAVPIATFTFSVDGTQAIFNGTAENAESYSWDFGDDTPLSTEQDPIHDYAKPGKYTVTFTASGKGGTDSETMEVEILPSFKYLLTGGLADTDGKTWKLATAVAGDGIGAITNDLTLAMPLNEGDDYLSWANLMQGYKDKFTFFYNDDYKVDNSDNYDGSLICMLHAQASGDYVLEEYPKGDVLGESYAPDIIPLLDIRYTPKTDATWTLNEDDFDVDAINTTDGSSYTETFTGKKQLILGDYFGFIDHSSLVIVKDITETEMHVAIALYGYEKDPTKPTHFFHLTFKAELN